MKLSNLFLAATIGLSTQVSLAHGAWLAERLDTPTIVYGEGGRDNGYDPEKVTYAQAFDEDGTAIDATIKKNENNVAFDGEVAFSAAAFVMTNGYYTKTKEGNWINKPKNEVEGEIEKSVYSVKTGLGYLGEGTLPSIDALSELDLVIYPETDLHDIKPGAKLDVIVYFQGKPAAGIEVVDDYITSGEKVATTDESGKASITIRNNGLNVVKVGHKVETEGDDAEKADSISYASSLSFVANEHDHHH